MAVPTSVIWASEVIGFISFTITLLTLLGVYRDLIATIRHAPGQIPIVLGNLRQEIEAERVMLRRRCAEGDEFGVFARGAGAGRRLRARSRRRTNEVAGLLMRTVEKLWVEFQELERPFLIRSGRRAEAVRKGGYWAENDVDEKGVGAGARWPGMPKKGTAGGGGGGRRTNAVEMEEAHVGLEENYYRTDLTHRFIWWQSKSDVESLANQVQRVQIRRIERDVFECDELVKRLTRKMDGGGDHGSSGSGSESDDRGPRGGEGISRRGNTKSVGGSGGKTMYESQEREAIRIPARSRTGSVRAVSRAGSVSRVRSISPPRRRSPRLRERTGESTASPIEQRSSNTARRRAARDSRFSLGGGRGDGGGYDYEVVRPGRDGTYTIDTNDPRSRPGPRESQGKGQSQSYDRERSVTREQRRGSDPRDRDRDKSRARYDDDE